MSDNLKEWLRDIFFAAVIAAVILLIIMPTVVKESSMENTLVENDYLIVSKIPYTLVGNYKKGDIIVFQSTIPNDGSDRGISILQPKYKILVKRIVADGGDTIAISEGSVYVNGETDTVAKAAAAVSETEKTSLIVDGVEESVEVGFEGISEGDVIEFICDYYDYNTTYQDSYVIGETLTVGKDGLTVSTMLLSDRDQQRAQPAYRFTDIYNQQYWTPIIPK